MCVCVYIYIGDHSIIAQVILLLCVCVYIYIYKGDHSIIAEMILLLCVYVAEVVLLLCDVCVYVEGNSISKDNFVITAQPHIVYELTAIYGFLNVSADTDKNKLDIASSILA